MPQRQASKSEEDLPTHADLAWHAPAAFLREVSHHR